MSKCLLTWLTLASLGLSGLLAGCATPQGQVVLLPNPEGRATEVQVTQGQGPPVALNQAYAAAQLSSAGPKAFTSSAAEVQSRFGAALAAQPQPPARFTLYFAENKDEFTDASKRDIDSVFTEIANRPVPDVVVIGHTDAVGRDAVNDPLSRQRAEVVRNALIARGVAPANIVVVGRGKRELLVPTADGVAEARNRRVEIQVR